MFRKGDAGQHFFIVMYGKCFVQSEDDAPDKKTEITYYPGDSFG